LKTGALVVAGIVALAQAGSDAWCGETLKDQPGTSVPLTGKDLPPVALADEELTSYTLAAGVRVLEQKPKHLKADAPTRVVLYALPNGNTLEQTFGRAEAPGQDWHYQIQHIGAQTRRVRELLPNENLVTVLLQANQKSWPAWHKATTNSSDEIVRLVAKLHEQFGTSSTVDLVSHSGGGSFAFGFLNGLERVPDYVRRITFIDSNYGFDEQEGHARKLFDWLNRSAGHRLLVLCYDDRNIVLNGKPIVSATGGTFRATSRMSAAFATSTTLESGMDRDFVTTRGLDGRLEMKGHLNPEQKILHTVLVEKNGFVYALTAGVEALPARGAAEDFYAGQSYRKWIR
jgi:hypothetical protein